MFIYIFRGLGISLVEGCAGDFRQNAAECERVQPTVHQRASEGIRQSRSRTFDGDSYSERDKVKFAARTFDDDDDAYDWWDDLKASRCF